MNFDMSGCSIINVNTNGIKYSKKNKQLAFYNNGLSKIEITYFFIINKFLS